MATKRAVQCLLSPTLRRPTRGVNLHRQLGRSASTSGQETDLSRRKIERKSIEFLFPTPADVVSRIDPTPRDVRIRGSSIKVSCYSPKDRSWHWQTLSPRWVRDHCKCPACMNQDTGQRQINVLKGDIDCTISKAEHSEKDKSITVTFGDGHTTTLPKRAIFGRDRRQMEARHGIADVHTWDASVADSPPSVRYEDLPEEGLGPLLKNIRTHGFCFVEGTPATPEATQSLLEAIGPIRNTHYGGFYDFTADLSSKDTAYTSESLEPHNDNTYFTEPAGLQALHLLSHTDGSGGESSLVDGFEAARKLFHLDRHAYQRLAQTGVYGHASGNEGISMQPAEAHPVLKHHAQLGSLMQVRWNNADRAGLHSLVESLDDWYGAASQFDAILSDPENQYWFQLTPGKLLIFDNWRLLHGRAAFTGKRRMCGGYINRDDWISKYRQTNMTPEEIEASTVTG